MRWAIIADLGDRISILGLCKLKADIPRVLDGSKYPHIELDLKLGTPEMVRLHLASWLVTRSYRNAMQVADIAIRVIGESIA